MPRCPDCKVELVERQGDCADDDPDCECDAMYQCPKCDQYFVDPCPAHEGETWADTRRIVKETDHD